MAWFTLIIAGCLEIAGVINMKTYTRTRLKRYYLLIFIMFALSFSLLSYSMREIPMAVAYAVWTGIGTAGSALLGIVIFKDKLGVRALLFILMILVGVIGLKLWT